MTMSRYNTIYLGPGKEKGEAEQCVLCMLVREVELAVVHLKWKEDGKDVRQAAGIMVECRLG